MSDRFFLIDGHAQTYRAYYAMEGLTAPDGAPSGAVFGFTRMLMDIQAKYEPTYLAVVFDRPGPTFRHEVYPEYKANRKPAPDALLQQVPVIQEVVTAFGLPQWSLDGYEADDLLGSLARQAVERSLDVVLVSGDKDLAQLLSDHVMLYDPKRDRFTTAADFVAKRGVQPARLPDVMGLWGDTSDNIPGVPGIGEKGAFALIAKYGDLPSLLAHADEIKGKRGEKLRAHEADARLSARLATIDCEAPVTLDLDAARDPHADEAALLALYDRMGFSSLKKNLGLFTAAAAQEVRDYHLVSTPEEFSAFLTELRKQTHVAVDVETTSTDPMQAVLVGMSFSWASGTGWYLPFRSPEGAPALGEAELRALAPLLADSEITKTGHNLKYDELVLRCHGLALRGISFDSMLASHLLQGHIRGHSLDASAERYLELETTPIADLIGRGRKQVTMDQVPLAQVCPYAAEDADVALRLEAHLRPALEESGLQPLLDEVELPLAGVLTDMQERGIRIDAALLGRMSTDMEKQLERLTGEIHFLAGHEFNIASPKQLAEVLFDELDFPVVRKTKTMRSTDEAVLTQLARLDHEKRALPRLLLEYRMYSKLKSTYIDALPTLINLRTGRVHTTFHQTGTATGRLSSRDPNLQNIPIRTAEGRGIRAAFIPAEGWTLLAADYSQIELRMLAHLSEDQALADAFAAGKDIHRTVAASVFHLDETEVTDEQRRAAKAINFGIVYGQTAFGLSQATGMNRAEAGRFIDDYFASFPKVKTFIDEAIAAARETGHVHTIRGRRREIPDIASSNQARRAQAERVAVNTIVQGSAAELIKVAMIGVHRRLRSTGLEGRLLLQIHDELVGECPAAELEPFRECVVTEMESALPLRVPVEVAVGTGSNWLEAK